ncbi:MAG: Fur family transcriptional regulator [Gemmatimonadales bacterium]
MERNTRQRDAIRDAFRRADRPLSTDEVHLAARKTVPSLGVATVYRTIRSLQGEGWLATVELPGAPARYELTGKAHHHHFHCERCDKVFDLVGCPATLQDLLPRSFRLDRHELVLYGRCADCARAA